jgi:hypothetical protein
MLGLDHRDGLGMPVDRMKAAKAFEEVVLSVRTFYTGRAGWTDDSSFEKISVELPSLHEDVVVDVAAPNVRFYYASGSSSWSPTAGDRFALHATGTVRISSVDERTGIVGAQLDLTFRPRDIKCSGLEGESEPKTIHEARWFARKSREQLSAWQGGSRRNLRNFP